MDGLSPLTGSPRRLGGVSARTSRSQAHLVASAASRLARPVHRLTSSPRRRLGSHVSFTGSPRRLGGVSARTATLAQVDLEDAWILLHLLHRALAEHGALVEDGDRAGDLAHE